MNHISRTPYSPLTNGLVEVQTRNIFNSHTGVYLDSHSLIINVFLHGFYQAEHGILEKYYFVHCHITNKLIPLTSTFETTNSKQIPVNSFAIHHELQTCYILK